jgi:ABC-type multidrug transport system ATPase subunit
MIEVQHVSKSFGRVAALVDVSLHVARGERVAFVGPNGSGKTTLLRALLGLLRVDGRVAVGGVDVAREPEVALRQVAYIPQIAPPLEAPVREVVRAACALRGLAPAAVAERADRLGLDLAAAAPKRFRDLSGGMKQKLLAALALAAEADVLVCDEPTANLDAEARAAFFELCDARPKGGVVVLCSHRIEEVQKLVDRVVELREGRVERDTPVAALLSGLRAYRVEVALEPGAVQAGEFLRAHGFAPIGGGRLGALFTQAEKVDLVARLLRAHEGAIVDLSVYQEGELRPDDRRAPSALRVVA